jgi:hypothetical protein
VLGFYFKSYQLMPVPVFFAIQQHMPIYGRLVETQTKFNNLPELI